MRRSALDSIDLTKFAAQTNLRTYASRESKCIRSYLQATPHNVFLQRRDACDKTRHGLSSLRNCCTRDAAAACQ